MELNLGNEVATTMDQHDQTIGQEIPHLNKLLQFYPSVEAYYLAAKQYLDANLCDSKNLHHIQTNLFCDCMLSEK